MLLKQGALAMAVTLLSIFSISICQAQEQILLGFGVGQTKVNVEEQYRFASWDEEIEGASINATLGYRMEDMFDITLRRSVYIDWTMFDVLDVATNYDLTETAVGANLLFPIGPVLIKPQMGITHWDVEIKPADGFWGSGEPSVKVDGWDPYLGLAAEMRFGRVFSMELDYRYGFYDFADIDTLALNFLFRF